MGGNRESTLHIGVTVDRIPPKIQSGPDWIS